MQQSTTFLFTHCAFLLHDVIVSNVIASYFSTYTFSIMHDNFVLDGNVGAFGLWQHTYDSSKNNTAILTAITIQRHG